MNQEHFSSIKVPVQKKKNFVYNGTKYPVDFGLVKRYSRFFYENRNNYKFVEDIEIKPDGYELPEKFMPIFVAFCQNEPFDLNDENVFTLLQLSDQYEVTILHDLIIQYIMKNQKPLIFQSILYKLHNQNASSNIDLSAEEDIIASNFFEFINEDQLVMLPVPVLYRIINKEQMQINSMDLTKQGQFIEFLFKCLEKHQREASILFMNLDIENERVGVLTQLLSRYSNVFDFNFMNSKFLSKSVTFLLSELQKLKIEMDNKIEEMEQKTQKQQDFFVDAQKKFEESKIGLLESNRSLVEKVAMLERKLNEQALQFERYTKVKIREIEINSDQKFMRIGSTIKLTTLIKPETAFNDNVDWTVNQEVEGTVNVESKDGKTIILKCLQIGKVTVVASALDGSGVSANLVLLAKPLKGKIEINVQQNQAIKGTIEISEENEEQKLDTSRSKFMLNSDSSSNLGENAYQSANNLDELVKNVSFFEPQGDYYLHVLVVDNFGSSQELISQALHTEGAQPLCFGYTGSVQPVELESGSYKLEAWGAQGGSFNSSFYGGYGGYATGTINLQSKTTLYVVVGKSANSTSGSYNGGGSGGIYKSGSNTFTSYGGGGASHIGLKSGMLTSFSGDFSTNLLIAAGGGGGAIGTNCSGWTYYNSIGGNGGGFNGSNGNSNISSSDIGTGATQSQGGTNSRCNALGSFGKGSDNMYHVSFEGGGGGGGFYGGGSGGYAGSGGGGSGFINTSKLSEAFMYGYNVPSSSSTETKTFSTSNASSDPVSNHAKKNDGYVKITPV